jgi:hypothetical protein
VSRVILGWVCVEDDVRLFDVQDAFLIKIFKERPGVGDTLCGCRINQVLAGDVDRDSYVQTRATDVDVLC